MQKKRNITFKLEKIRDSEGDINCLTSAFSVFACTWTGFYIFWHKMIGMIFSVTHAPKCIYQMLKQDYSRHFIRDIIITKMSCIVNILPTYKNNNTVFNIIFGNCNWFGTIQSGEKWSSSKFIIVFNQNQIKLKSTLDILRIYQKK